MSPARDRRADRAAVEHAGEGEVVDVCARAGGLPDPVLARDVGADRARPYAGVASSGPRPRRIGLSANACRITAFGGGSGHTRMRREAGGEEPSGGSTARAPTRPRPSSAGSRSARRGPQSRACRAAVSYSTMFRRSSLPAPYIGHEPSGDVAESPSVRPDHPRLDLEPAPRRRSERREHLADELAVVQLLVFDLADAGALVGVRRPSARGPVGKRRGALAGVGELEERDQRPEGSLLIHRRRDPTNSDRAHRDVRCGAEMDADWSAINTRAHIGMRVPGCLRDGVHARRFMLLGRTGVASARRFLPVRPSPMSSGIDPDQPRSRALRDAAAIKRKRASPSQIRSVDVARADPSEREDLGWPAGALPPAWRGRAKSSPCGWRAAVREGGGPVGPWPRPRC